MDILGPEERQHRLKAAEGAVKALAARVPGLGELLAGWDAYQRNQHDLYVVELIGNLQREVTDLKALFSDESLRTPEGQRFARKVIGAALDPQLEEKHQLFARVLARGISDKSLDDQKRLLFVDLIRRLPLNALLVLAGLERLFGHQAQLHKVEGRQAPQMTRGHVIPELSRQENLHPYMVEQGYEELVAAGLFSLTSQWYFDAQQSSYRRETYVSPGDSFFYTDFTAEFARFLKKSGNEQGDAGA